MRDEARTGLCVSFNNVRIKRALVCFYWKKHNTRLMAREVVGEAQLLLFRVGRIDRSAPRRRRKTADVACSFFGQGATVEERFLIYSWSPLTETPQAQHRRPPILSL